MSSPKLSANNNKDGKRIAIIGAGASGITSARQCLDSGLSVVVFERSSTIAGLWRYKAPPVKGDDTSSAESAVSVMKSTIVNTSKELTAFSNFPPPPESPNFMHNSEMLKYLEDYASCFAFSQYVRFRQEIVSVEMASDYSKTGKWLVSYRNLDTAKEKNDVESEIFDGVMICTGHHGTPSWPTNLQGLDNFSGPILHSHQLKSGAGFEGKRTLIVGLGNSGGDAAVDLAAVGGQVFLSTRRGSWLWHRVGPLGRPYDTYIQRRFLKWANWWTPYWIICTAIEAVLNTYINHKEYGLKPKNRVLSQHGLINDALPNLIITGRVKIKGDIKSVEKNGVVFKGENTVTPVDMIILATGYKFTFPFLSDDILQPTAANQVHLYEHVFIPHLAHPQTLAIIGLIQPIGCLINTAEMQARWFVELNLPGTKIRLPFRKEMDRAILKREAQVRARFYDSSRHTIEVDWLPYLDAIAGRIGVSPPLWKCFFTDPRLYWALVFGPAATYQYRLSGPQSWPEARQTILEIGKRIRAPLQTNQQPGRSSGNFLGNFSVVPFLIAAFICAVLGSAIATFLAMELFWNQDSVLGNLFFNLF